MNITPAPMGTNQIKRILLNMENYRYNPFNNHNRIEPKTLSSDLHIIGKQCNTTQLKDFLTNTFIKIAERMSDANQDNLAGIIYSYLLKINTDNFPVQEAVALKALKIAQKQKDSVHIASRANELADIYKFISKENYLKYLKVKRNALKDVCTNYETAGNRFRTISREYNSKDVYVLTLIRTEIDIAKTLMHDKPEVAKRELLNIYQKACDSHGEYRIDQPKNLKELMEIKKFIQTLLTDMIFRTQTSSVMQDYSIAVTNILKSIRNKEPIKIGPFIKHFSELYDKFKKQSMEQIFMEKTFDFITALKKSGDTLFGSKLYTILLNKNVDNPENTKTIARHGLKLRQEENDDFGIVFFGQTLINAIKKSEKFSMREYLDAINPVMTSSRNIINNYDEMLKTAPLKPKDFYIKQLIFYKVESAKILKNRNPEYHKAAYKEIEQLLKLLPQSEIDKHPKFLNIQEYIKSNFN